MSISAMKRIDRPQGSFEYAQEGEGPDLLLVHSLLTDASVFDGIAPRLAGHRRVTWLNLPGYGASVPRSLTTIADYADFLCEALDALDLGAQTDLFANGFGAFVASEFALRHRGRIRRLIVADVNAGFPEAGRIPFGVMAGKVTEGGMQTVLDAAIGRMFPEPFQQAHPAVVAERKRRLATADAASFARACRALAALDLAARLPALTTPTWVLCGALDRTTPPELAEQMAALIPGARYASIEGSGHCPMLEQPDQLIALVEGALA
jgi:3-oxoadipate enol-lactonase